MWYVCVVVGEWMCRDVVDVGGCRCVGMWVHVYVGVGVACGCVCGWV